MLPAPSDLSNQRQRLLATARLAFSEATKAWQAPSSALVEERHFMQHNDSHHRNQHVHMDDPISDHEDYHGRHEGNRDRKPPRSPRRPRAPTPRSASRMRLTVPQQTTPDEEGRPRAPTPRIGKSGRWPYNEHRAESPTGGAASRSTSQSSYYLTAYDRSQSPVSPRDADSRTRSYSAQSTRSDISESSRETRETRETPETEEGPDLPIADWLQFAIPLSSPDSDQYPPPGAHEFNMADSDAVGFLDPAQPYHNMQVEDYEEQQLCSHQVEEQVPGLESEELPALPVPAPPAGRAAGTGRRLPRTESQDDDIVSLSESDDTQDSTMQPRTLLSQPLASDNDSVNSVSEGLRTPEIIQSSSVFLAGPRVTMTRIRNESESSPVAPPARTFHQGGSPNPATPVSRVPLLFNSPRSSAALTTYELVPALLNTTSPPRDTYIVHEPETVRRSLAGSREIGYGQPVGTGASRSPQLHPDAQPLVYQHRDLTVQIPTSAPTPTSFTRMSSALSPPYQATELSSSPISPAEARKQHIERARQMLRQAEMRMQIPVMTPTRQLLAHARQSLENTQPVYVQQQ